MIELFNHISTSKVKINRFRLINNDLSSFQSPIIELLLEVLNKQNEEYMVGDTIEVNLEKLPEISLIHNFKVVSKKYIIKCVAGETNTKKEVIHQLSAF